MVNAFCRIRQKTFLPRKKCGLWYLWKQKRSGQPLTERFQTSAANHEKEALYINLCAALHRIWQWKKKKKLQKTKQKKAFPPMIMKVFGITVNKINKRKPCTKEQTERGEETEKDTVWHSMEQHSIFNHLVGYAADCHQICPFFYYRTVSQHCWSVKCNAGLYYTVFPKVRFFF